MADDFGGRFLTWAYRKMTERMRENGRDRNKI